jgi:DNA polymerase-4
MLQALCRNCGWIGARETPPARCPRCGSPRLIAHAELTELSIAHVDCDAFYASIEKRDDPGLRDKPLIVGGGTRGVVSTCCYIARQSGVRSAMPMFTALKLCPDAVVIRPNMAKYVAVSRQVRALMDRLTPLVEPLSIDEAFLDLSGTTALHRASPAEVLSKLARDVESELGITLSIGLSHNKFLAKTASDLDKPRGFAVIGRAETLAFLAAQPVDLIFGVGKVFAETLRRDGFDTIGQLQQAAPEDLMRRYGETGARLARLSRGEDSRAVNIDGEMKTISAETTFNTDLSGFEELSTELLALSERLSERVKARNLVGDTVTLKLKSAGFRLRTRARHLMIST